MKHEIVNMAIPQLIKSVGIIKKNDYKEATKEIESVITILKDVVEQLQKSE